MRSIRLRFESWRGSALRKKRGASSVSHLGSIAITSRMYLAAGGGGEAEVEEEAKEAEVAVVVRMWRGAGRVLLGGEYELVVDEPLRVAVEEGGRRVDVDDLPLVHGLVPLLRVLLGRVHEEARADRLAHLSEVLAR